MTEVWHSGNLVSYSNNPHQVLQVSGFEYTALRRYDQEPGIYRDLDFVRLDDPEGPSRNVRAPASLLQAVERVASPMSDDKVIQRDGSDLMLYSPLPETPFYEGDIVRSGLSTWRVVDIDYLALVKRGVDYPAYGLNKSFVPYAVQRWRRADKLRLVERGPVWQTLYEDPITNLSVAAMYDLVRGETLNMPMVADLRRARSLLGSRGIHSFFIAPKEAGEKETIVAYQFRNNALGQHVAELGDARVSRGHLPTVTLPRPGLLKRSFPEGGRPPANLMIRALGLNGLIGPIR